MKFNHFGVPTTQEREGAGFHPVLRLHYSSAINPLFRIEYLKFDEDCIFNETITSNRHLGFEVDSIDETLKLLNVEVLHSKTTVSDTLTICYVQIEDVLVELMEYKK